MSKIPTLSGCSVHQQIGVYALRDCTFQGLYPLYPEFSPIFRASSSRKHRRKLLSVTPEVLDFCRLSSAQLSRFKSLQMVIALLACSRAEYLPTHSSNIYTIYYRHKFFLLLIFIEMGQHGPCWQVNTCFLSLAKRFEMQALYCILGFSVNFGAHCQRLKKQLYKLLRCVVRVWTFLEGFWTLYMNVFVGGNFGIDWHRKGTWTHELT